MKNIITNNELILIPNLVVDKINKKTYHKLTSSKIMAGIIRVMCDNGHVENLMMGDSDGTIQEDINETIEKATCGQCGAPVRQTSMTD